MRLYALPYRTVLVVVFFALLTFGCGGGAGSPVAPNAPQATPVAPKPNIVLIVADDLDAETLKQLLKKRQPPTAQPLLDELAMRGLSFTQAFATQPLCSPSRASILTGRYTWNHGVWDNVGPHGGYGAFMRNEADSLAPWLKAAGYRTVLVGKYMNDQRADSRPIPGWTERYVLLSGAGGNRYFDYFMDWNGDIRQFGFDPRLTEDQKQENYSVNVEVKRVVESIRPRAVDPAPLFVYLSVEAPHRDALYAAGYGGEFRDVGMPETPSFNRGDDNARFCWTPQPEPLSTGELNGGHRLQQFRLRSMRAVEDGYQRILAALYDTGRLEDTYIVFVSDNGVHMGQRGLIAQKNNPFEPSINIPLIIRGPGVPVGATDAMAATIDLAPTIRELAGLPPRDDLDGRSLVPFLRGQPPASWRTDLLIMNYDGDRRDGTMGGISLALRSKNWMYSHGSDETRRLYDMRADPHQRHNSYCEMSQAFIDELEQRIATLYKCRGATCRN